MSKEKTPIGEMDDVLDQIKAIEKAVKAQTLIKVLSTLKGYAREILELKEKTAALLEGLGISEADTKRIIDFVNNTPEVQLSDSDKRNIRKEAKETVQRQKKNSQEELEKKFTGSSFPFIGYTQTVSTPGTYSYTVSNSLNDAPNVTLSNGSAYGGSLANTTVNMAATASNLTAMQMLNVADSLGDELHIKL